MEKITLKPDIELLEKHGLNISLYYKELSQNLPSDVQITENLELEVNSSYYEKFLDALKKTGITKVSETLLYIGLTQISFKRMYFKESDITFDALTKFAKDGKEFIEFFQRNGIYKGNLSLESGSGHENIQEIIIKTNSESLRISHPSFIYCLLNGFAEGIDKASFKDKEQAHLEWLKDEDRERIRQIKEEIDLRGGLQNATITQLEELREIELRLEEYEQVDIQDEFNRSQMFFRSREKESTRWKKSYAKRLFNLIGEIHPNVPKDRIYHCIGLVFYISGIVFMNTYDNTPYDPFAPDFQPDALKNNIKKLFA